MRIPGFAYGVAVLLSSAVFLSACSSMAIPVIVLRRLHDVGIAYKTNYKAAEHAVTAVVSDMGCSVRYVTRVPGTVKGKQVEEAGSMTIHCECPGGARYPKPFGFEVDIDPVSGHPDQMKIRFGAGDFGDKDMALRFHQKLAGKLQMVGELPAAGSAEAKAPAKSDAEAIQSMPVQEYVTHSGKPVPVEGGMVEELEVKPAGGSK